MKMKSSKKASWVTQSCVHVLPDLLPTCLGLRDWIPEPKPKGSKVCVTQDNEAP